MPKYDDEFYKPEPDPPKRSEYGFWFWLAAIIVAGAALGFCGTIAPLVSR